MSVSMTRWPARGAARQAFVASRESTAAGGVAALSDPARQRRRGEEPGTRASDVREQRQPLGRRDEHAHVAVAQDVGDLLGLEQRIERNEHATGRAAPKDATTVSKRLSR